jgi:hypothetical protein
VAQTDAVAATHGGGVTDTGTTITDTVSATKTALRGPTDQGVTQTDTLSRAFVREIADQAVTQADTLAVTAHHTVAITDQAVTQSDSLDTTAAGVVHRTDIGAAQSDQLRRAITRRLVDVGDSQADQLVILVSLHLFLSDRGVRFSDFVGAIRRVLTSVSGPTSQPVTGDGLEPAGPAARTAQRVVRGHTSQPIIYSHPKE